MTRFTFRFVFGLLAAVALVTIPAVLQTGLRSWNHLSTQETQAVAGQPTPARTAQHHDPPPSNASPARTRETTTTPRPPRRQEHTARVAHADTRRRTTSTRPPAPPQQEPKPVQAAANAPQEVIPPTVPDLGALAQSNAELLDCLWELAGDE